MTLLAKTRRTLRNLVLHTSPAPVRRWLGRHFRVAADAPAVGTVAFGSFRRLDPLSREWGMDRGGPIDRHYIEDFLRTHREDIRGRVLEIGESLYTRMFGEGRATQSDILVYDRSENPNATFEGDLTSAPDLPDDAFDCVIITQTLQLIYDVPAAIATLHRVLKPGGIVLATAPGITQINRRDDESWGEYWCWNFTALSLRRRFGEHFSPADVEVRTYGNVLAAAGFLYGLGRGELSYGELNHHDPDYEVIIGVRARKGERRGV